MIEHVCASLAKVSDCKYHVIEKMSVSQNYGKKKKIKDLIK